MPVVSFQNLPIVDETWRPAGMTDAKVIADILGDDTLETKAGRDKMKRAHLWWDGDGTTLAGYKLKIARPKDGRLTTFWRQLTSRLAILNGARGGVDIPAADKKKAFNHALRYYDKQEVSKEDQPAFTGERGRAHLVRSFIVKLADMEPAEGDEPKWVHVATEGEYLGYRDGPFEFTREIFEQLVANLHRHPAYVAGPNGVGTEDIIPWDFSHVTERDPVEGSIPTQGAPAQGWTRELQVRNGEGGKAQLWALTRFLELARAYIKKGQYKWASVAVSFESTDPVTAEDVGAVMSSIALTNQPFIEGMERLVASKNSRGKGSPDQVQARNMYFEPADSAEEAVNNLKDLFGLPETAGVGGVIAEIAKLQQWVVSGTVPLGVDVASIMGGIRKILGLPALTTEAEVMEEVTKLVERLLQEQALNEGQPGAAPQPGTAPAGAVATAKEKAMELLKRLARVFGVRESDDEVVAAAEEAVALRAGCKKVLSADKDTNVVLLEEASSNADARAKLTGIFTALGVEDAEAAVERVAELLKQASELTEAMPELESLRTSQRATEDQQAEADVDGAIAAYKIPESTKDALLLYRKGEPEKFKKAYPPPVENAANLTANLVATKTGVAIQPGRPGTPAPDAVLGAGVVNLVGYRGVNPTERAMNWLLDNKPGAKDWTHDELFEAACNLKRLPGTIVQASV